MEGTFSQIVGVLSLGTRLLLLVIDFIGTATNPYPKRICFAFSDKDKETGKPYTLKAVGIKGLMAEINFFSSSHTGTYSRLLIRYKEELAERETL